MMAGMRARRRADDFNALVEGFSAHGAERRASERFTDDLELVAQMRAIEPVDPRPEFAAALRADLMAEAVTVLTPTAAKLTVRPRQTTRERRVAVIIGGFAAVSASASMAVASQSSLPGETLYPLKRAIEQAQSHLQFDEERRADVLLQHAAGRLTEAQALAGEGDDAELAATLYDFADQARDAADVILDQYQGTGDEQQVQQLGTFATSSLEALDDLKSDVPASARPALIEATQVVEQIDQQVLYSCVGCGPDVAPMAALTRDLLAGAAEPEVKLERVQKPTEVADGTGASNQSSDSGGTTSDTVEKAGPSPVDDSLSKTTDEATGTLKQLTDSVTGTGDGTLLGELDNTLDNSLEGLEDTTKGLLGGK